ncbi:GNAT family N-acetyltransferase [Croceicoccus sediminis]|uniref:GNAT family N-acetyltransferase n=1 Tax=Croceicoccus sediminis TaxID=2571150 RepID=UPI0011820F0B|nr:N-acetyltransferase [Croceicoccus sediminis]
MIIREEQESDHSAIAKVTAQAFAGVEHSDQTEPEIIARLRTAGALTISLVAIKGNTFVGHVAFSPITIDGADKSWFGLGPVSVSPDHQQLGIGSALIRTGLERLCSQGAAGCVVLGDPAYYCRFGFERDEGLRFYAAPSEYFMRLNFAAEVPRGRVDYAPAFAG